MVKGMLVLLFLFVFITNVICNTNLENYFSKHLDVNSDSVLDVKDLRTALCKHTGNCKFTDQQVKAAIRRLDIDGSGTISKTEFLSQLGKYKKNVNTSQKIEDPIEGGPQQVHLALTTDPTSVVVQWISRDRDDPSQVLCGTQPGSFNISVSASTYTYNAGVFGWNGWIHKAVVTGLQTNTKYNYAVQGNNLVSPHFSFTTPPSVSDGAAFSKNVFGVVADQGTYIPMGWAVIDQMVADHKKIPFSMIVHAGDVCYAGTGSDWEFEDIWDTWEDMVEPLAANIPYMFAVGNHEHYYDYAAYKNRFTMGGNTNFWYSIDYGNTHFTFISTEHDFSAGSPQYNWIIQDWTTANANRKLRPWLIMLGHRPWYNSDTSEWEDHTVGGRIQKELESTMVKYGVDVYLCGHQHMYERTHPTVNGSVLDFGGSQKNYYVHPSAPLSVVQATAGVFLDDKFVDPQPVWSAYRTDEWGYGRMTVNETHLHYEFLLEKDGSLRDQFWIVKN